MISKKLFDNYNNRDVYLYELVSDKLKVGIIDFGAAIQYVKLVTENGEKDVCLGFDRIEDYIESGTYCGATIGRVANRIGGGRFELNGESYNLPKNDNGNTLHGGTCGFDKRFFDAAVCGDVLTMSLKSADGDMGFSGNLDFSAQFELKGSSLEITYTAVSDKDTVWNPTCHAYFDLSGKRDIKNTLLKINAGSFTPIDDKLIPVGDATGVFNTPFDFTDFKPIGRDIDEPDEQLERAGGYDHNFILKDNHAATAYCKESGVRLDVYTDMPGLQFYSGNMLKGNGRGGKFGRREAFCLEPQYFPNAVNIAWFDRPVIFAGVEKRHFIRYSFT